MRAINASANLYVCNPQCINCREAGKRCDPGRPCSRCRKKGLRGCQDAPTKRRKPDGSDGKTLEYLRVTASSSTVPTDQGESKCIISPSARSSYVSLVSPQFGSSDATSSTGAIPTETISSSIQLPSSSAGQYTIGAGLSEGYLGLYAFNSASAVGQAAYGYSDSTQALTVPAQAIPPTAFPPTAGYPSVQSGAARMVPPYHSSQNEVGSWTNEGHPAGGNRGVGSGGFEALPESDFQSSASDHQFPWGQTQW